MSGELDDPLNCLNVVVELCCCGMLLWNVVMECCCGMLLLPRWGWTVLLRQT
jgi:hypothetical protein